MNRVLSVSQLNNYIKSVFEDELLLHDITVQGEVFEIKFSGANTFVTVKEGECVLSCIKFGAKLEFDVGDIVSLTGSVRFYPGAGKTSFIISYAAKSGKGNIADQFNKLKQKLKDDGVFDNNFPLPFFVSKVALITSADGAVLHDFMSVLTKNSCAYIDVDVYDVRVQGDTAHKMICNAVYKACAKNYDVIVVARGGGSDNDLGAFNCEDVARAVFACKIPLISAVGHEINFTLCDYAASLRAGTPSIAAEMIAHNNASAVSMLSDRTEQMYRLLKSNFDKASSSVAVAAQKLATAQSDSVAGVKIKLNKLMWRALYVENDLAERCRIDLKEMYDRQKTAFDSGLSAKEQKLGNLTLSLDRISPLKILSLGYAKAYRGDKSVASVNDIKENDELKLIFRDGRANATVTSKEIYEHRRKS